MLDVFRYKVYYENREGTMGGHEVVSILKLMWWLIIGRIRPRERSAIYFIRKIELLDGTRI